MIEAYPLHWPTGWPRARRPECSRFAWDLTLAKARDGLLFELALLGARDVIISTNVAIRRDGLPYSSRKSPEDTGVAVYFKLKGADQCIPCDKWNTVPDNLRAIEKTVNALRGLERWGAKEMVNAAFRGFKALPEASETGAAWYDLLGVEPTASADQISQAYKRLALEHHPDKGGSTEAFITVKKAYEQGLAAAK